MIFLGTILGGDPLSVPLSPTSVTNNTKIILQNGTYDSLYVTKNITSPMTATPPTQWDFDTIMFAEFNGTTMAGNLLVSIDAITNLIIKRKKTTDFQWMTIDAKDILHDPSMTYEEKVAQMVMRGSDKTATIGYEYEYTAVPVLNGIESVYSTSVAKCISKGVVILDDGEVWMTMYTDNDIDTTAVVPNSVIETMWDRYPTVIRNTEANYETIQLTASFIEGDITCDTDWDDEVKNMEYSRRAYDFLRNDKPKILKATDGRIWLVYVTTPPTDAGDTNTGLRKLTFTCTEIGSMNSEADLWDAGFINADEIWWN